MFGGGVDSEVPSHLDTEVLSIPQYDEEGFRSQLVPVLTAKVGIIVEKDTLFNNMINSEFMQRNKEHIIMITVRSVPFQHSLQAKGYPDYVTRRFTYLLSSITHIPLFYIGDADPFGADIFFNYAFGNLNQSFDQVAVPIIKWIGPFLQEFQGVNGTMKLNERDELKAYSLMTKPYMQLSNLGKMIG